MVTQKPIFWSWLATVNGSVDFQIAQAFVNLTKALGVFLSVIIFLEIVIAVYVKAGIERFAEGIFNLSLNREPAVKA